MVDPYTKRLERKIHNQRVQLRWWDSLAAQRGWSHFRRLHQCVMESYKRTGRARSALEDENQRLRAFAEWVTEYRNSAPSDRLHQLSGGIAELEPCINAGLQEAARQAAEATREAAAEIAQGWEYPPVNTGDGIAAAIRAMDITKITGAGE